MKQESVFWRLLRGSMARLGSHVLQLVVQLVLVPFVVHSLGDRMYGLWTIVGVFVGYYGFLDLGLSSAVTRYLATSVGARDAAETNRIYSNALVMFSLIGAVALALTGIIIASSAFIIDNPSDLTLFRWLVLILGTNMAIEFPLRVFGGILTAQLRFEAISLLRVMTVTIRTALIVALLLNGYQIIGLAVATVTAAIPERLISIAMVLKGTSGLRLELSHVSWRNSRHLMSYGIFTLIAQVADELRFNIDSIVITAYLGLAAVTHYRVASLLITHSISIMSLAMGVLLPYFSRLEGEKASDETRRVFFASTRFSVCIAAFISFGLIAWGRPFMERWMGRDYLDAYPCLVVLSVGLLFALSQTPSVGLLYGTSRHKFFALFNLLEGLANLGLSLILVRDYGIVGVALGTLVPMLVIKIVVQPVYVCRVMGYSYTEYMDGYARAFGLAVLLLVGPAALTYWMAAPTYPALITVGGLSGAAFAAGFILLGLTSAERSFLVPSLKRTG